ncbi:DEAD/DEAH box helicase [Terriglobus roseus]|uniref:Superfamily II DNA or RNA helicase n=1 Tax=Terriglobus roseus TaxID=392734 RepID=A0A1G7HN90_9BACT|nr:DEAD/DEAH box helicase family protein [Terriglobus roseus]SDF01932.1 Superfamily II DNA or RNA helicase [Terriglobus roseus]
MNTLPKPLEAKLWDHQKKAIAFSIRLLRHEQPSTASLIRMPTGTGKTGVIAVLSVALPPPKWTLVLTPWANLCAQLIGDLRERFWNISEWRPSPAPRVLRLLPSNVDEVLGKEDAHVVLVATFTTLISLFKRYRSSYDALAARLSQVLVDEGHYEPAVEWGQAVKQLNVPTLLLTATPYRNDLKLFRVLPEHIFHYTHEDAERDQIIRSLTLQEMKAPEPRRPSDLTPWCAEFNTFWTVLRKTKHSRDARAIVCCGDMATVKSVTKRLRVLGINAVGIHDRFGKEKETWLKQDTPDPRSVDFDVWVHQNKLTEGLDDKRFRVLAILNRIRNDRKLIQQIGRILRRQTRDSNPAIVLYSSTLPIKRSWNNYRAFETQPGLNDPFRYRNLLHGLLSAQPDMEYFDGQFRRRFEPGEPSLKNEIRLLPSAVVRTVLNSFDWDQCSAFISDFLQLDDCILLGPALGYETGADDARLWTYAMFSNSPVLISGSQYEIRLGAMAAVSHNKLLFLTDTEGRYPDVYVNEHTRKLNQSDLGKVLTEKSVPHGVSLQNPWPAGPSIKRSTISSSDLAATSPQLTDSIFMCMNVRATVPPERVTDSPRRHYLGFSRGRISEQLYAVDRNEFSLDQFVSWTKDFAALIRSQRRRLPEFFQRYLAPAEPPMTIQATYLVLNIFEGDAEMMDEAGNALWPKETIIKLSVDNDDSGNPRFRGTVIFCRLVGPQQEQHYTFALVYHSKTNRFIVQGERWNAGVFVTEGEGKESHGAVSFLNNNDEQFTVAMREPDIFYNAQSFYKIDYSFAEDRLGGLLTTESVLETVTSEKGQQRAKQRSWVKSSLFGVIDWRNEDGLIATHFPDADFVFCDDLGKEIADFVCVSFRHRRISLIHAKHGDENQVSASALHVVVAQALKNLGVLARSGPKPPEIARWNRKALWSTTKVLRWRRGTATLPEGEVLWEKIRSDVLDHPDGKKEVWLVLGASLSKDSLLEQLRNQNQWTPVSGQVVYLLSSLNANCSQLQVDLRVFCD